MFEKYDTPIPDIEALLRRLDFSISGEMEKNLDNLNGLIYAWQTHIPFEDLNPSYYKRKVSLEIPDLFEKIVREKRGGYCFEMNGLFERMLKDLGYEAYSVYCRIVNGSEELRPCSHRGVIVKLENLLYYCDVGYGGPQPPGAVPVMDGHSLDIHGEVFETEKYDENWWLLKRVNSAGAWEAVLHFNLQPVFPVDFLPMNFYCSNDPEGLFVQHRIVNLRTENGAKSIMDEVYKVRDKDSITSYPIKSDEEFLRILKTEFGMTL